MQKHPDADAFMRAYLAQPADAVSRLVFADWLDETGAPHNAAWARYIRLKIEADRYPAESAECRKRNREADEVAPAIRARLTIPAGRFVEQSEALLELLPGPNIEVRLGDLTISHAVLELLPESVARENLVFPLHHEVDSRTRTFHIASATPGSAATADTLEFILNCRVILVRADPEEIREAIDRHYGTADWETFDTAFTESAATEGDLRLSGDTVAGTTGGSVSVDRLVNLILQEGINLRADRILLFPEFDSFGIRFRIGGEWVSHERWPIRLLQPVCSTLAQLASQVTRSDLTDPFAQGPLTGVFLRASNGVHLRVRVTILPSPDGPTTQIDLVREPVV
jgi:uncharacterized protein (TIGR02996 family)